jgi:nucleotide-binding universal stress UspA family protein
VSTVVVGLDGSAGDADALALAATLADAPPATVVVLVSVVRHGGVALAGDGLLAEALAGEARERLAAAGRPLAETGHRVEVEVEALISLPRLLVAVARRRRAGLLVVAAHGVGSLGRPHGDPGARVLHGAPCPVAVAPARYAATAGPLRRVGVAFDDGPAARVALETAVRIALRAGATLMLLSVVDPVLVGAPSAHGRCGGRLHRGAPAADRLAGVVAGLPPAVSPAWRRLHGAPAEALVGCTSSLDLLVCGSRGYGPARAVLVGSVARALVRHASCPVLVTPRGADEPPVGRPLPAAASA